MLIDQIGLNFIRKVPQEKEQKSDEKLRVQLTPFL